MVTQYVKLDFFGESLIHKLISLLKSATIFIICNFTSPKPVKNWQSKKEKKKDSPPG